MFKGNLTLGGMLECCTDINTFYSCTRAINSLCANIPEILIALKSNNGFNF